MSLALTADHLWNLPAAIQGEGHPILWYLLLRTAYALFDSPQVLPALSAGVALAGLTIFLLRAPFPLWWKMLFILGGLPLYEYSIISRSYGLSMSLLFAFAAQLTIERRSNIVLGALLFFLAQTNVHSALLVPPLLLAWLDRDSSWRAGAGRARRVEGALLAGLALAGAGLLCTFLTIYPSRHSLIVGDLSANAYAGGAYLKGFALALLEPGHFYHKITLLPTLLSTLVLFFLALGLARQRWLAVAALLGLWANAAVFAMLYEGEYRHQGIWFVFVIALYWISLGSNRAATTTAPARLADMAFRFCLNVLLPMLLLAQIAVGYQMLSKDLREERSKSRALALAIRANPVLRQAVIVAQPDEFLEAMPYYVDNPTYLFRQGQFGNNATWSLAFKRDLTMADLLLTLRRLKDTTGRPVVVIMSHRWADDGSDLVATEWLGRKFTASAKDLREFRQSTRRLDIGRDAYWENFDAYIFQ
jgi:hypothetical protein